MRHEREKSFALHGFGFSYCILSDLWAQLEDSAFIPLIAFFV